MTGLLQPECALWLLNDIIGITLSTAIVRFHVVDQFPRKGKSLAGYVVPWDDLISPNRQNSA